MLVDLARIDRQVAAAVAADARVRAALARLDEGGEAPPDPWPAHREVSGQRALSALREADVSAVDVPMRDALATWVAELTARRLAFSLDVKLAHATSAPAGRAGAGRAAATWREAMRGLLGSTSAGEARTHLAELDRAAPEIFALDAERRATRAEVLSRLGAPSPPAPAGVARVLLERTEDIAGEVCRVRPGDAPFPLHLDMRLGRAAVEGWPAHLGWRWVAEMLPAFGAVAAPRMGWAPEVFGAASFARALRAFGEAFAAAARPAGPFALRQPVRSVRARTIGCAIGGLPAIRAFYKRRMGLSPGTCRDQARALSAVALLQVRHLVARTLHDGSRASQEELTARALGPEVPPAAAAMLLRPRDADADTLRAVVATLPLLDALRDRFDEDWFDNPRAPAYLRTLAATEPEASAEPGEEDATRLARRLEEALA